MVDSNSAEMSELIQALTYIDHEQNCNVVEHLTDVITQARLDGVNATEFDLLMQEQISIMVENSVITSGEHLKVVQNLARCVSEVFFA